MCGYCVKRMDGHKGMEHPALMKLLEGEDLGARLRELEQKNAFLQRQLDRVQEAHDALVAGMLSNIERDARGCS